MTYNSNPYIQNLLEMGYDKQDVQVASTMFQKKTFPCVIHGRQFDTEEQYYAELHEYMSGMWWTHPIGSITPKKIRRPRVSVRVF